MVTLVHDCPHCDTQRAGFTQVGEAPIPRVTHGIQVFFQCNVCHEPLVAVASYRYPGNSAAHRPGNMVGDYAFSNFRFFPKASPSVAPGHVPDSIARAFIQAEDAIKRRHWEAAGAMDRRALEIATKDMASEHAGLPLFKRIEKLADDGKLTVSLKDWAHELRAVGNDAVHEMEGIDEQEATQTHELTRFILIYLYTLPKQVELAREERQNGN